MAGSVRNPPPIHIRREEIIRPADRRRDFPERVAQRYFQSKERPRWHLVAYGVFLAAVLIISGIAYTTYAFSKYRGEILPGVSVDGVALGELSTSQATNLITNIQFSYGTVPIRLAYGSHIWTPTTAQIGLQYDVSDTAKDAE